MFEVCHRCQSELAEFPERLPRAERLLFCPHCSAPQIRLPEHMRSEGDAAPIRGVAPPPRVAGPGIDWRAVLPTAAWVAGVGGLLSVLGLLNGFIDALSPLWVLASGSIVLTAYLRRRPNAWMNATAGWRVGVVTGLLLVGAKGAGLGAAGVVARFATHSMEAYDAQTARSLQAQQAMVASMFPAQSADQQFQAYQAMFARPEWQAGSALVGLGLMGGVVVVFAGLGGMFSGAVERRRRLVAGRG